MTLWKLFDDKWYLKKYKNYFIENDYLINNPEKYYLEVGCVSGHSPNPYFNEEWYLERYCDVKESIKEGIFKSGFDHYCSEGYKDRNPHWLFDEYFYLERYNYKKNENYNEKMFLNGYDYYLAYGDTKLESGHWLFDPELYQTHGLVSDSDIKFGLFKSLLREYPQHASSCQVSRFFDPVWYQLQYPKVRYEIEDKKWDSYLHHYLCNKLPLQFDPNEFFSEDFYLAVNPDIANAIQEKRFRNGYEHFLKFGALEKRQPSSNLDIRDIYNRSLQLQYEVEEKIFSNAFEAFLASPGKNSLLKDETPVIAEDLARSIFKADSKNRIFSSYKHKIDFTYKNPVITIIMITHNNFDFTLSALTSIRGNFREDMQIILVDSGSKDSIKNIENYVVGVDILRFKRNIGFLYGCNAALEHIKAKATLLVNNDIVLLPGAIPISLKRLWSSDKIGAVGGKIIRTNGLLQEAGSIVWRDGSVEGYLRDASPLVPEANFVRSVDFCSGVFLNIKTDLLRKLNGFDEGFAPAYFEETDLCLRIRKLGFDIIYDHNVSLIHYEYGTSGSASAHRLIEKNQHYFSKKHFDYLKNRPIRNINLIAKARSFHKNPVNILFVEDRLPFKSLGSGFARSQDIIRVMSEIGYNVTVYPVYKAIEHLEEIYAEFPESAEVIYDRELPDLKSFLESRPNYFNVIWIARTHNAERVGKIINQCAHILPTDHIILDTEAIASTREILKEELIHKEGAPAVDDRLESKLKAEFMYAYISSAIVAVNAEEKNLLTKMGFEKVYQLGHQQVIKPTKKSYEERKSLLFVGAIHDENSPNLDALSWFSSEVLPLLAEKLPEDCFFTYAGYTRENIDLGLFKNNTRVSFLGYVENLDELYNDYRVFVVPTRYAAGIPYKVHEAASYGIPMVVSDLVGKQVGWENNADFLCADTTDPKKFADRVCALYSDKQLWSTLQKNALNRIKEENNKDIYSSTIKTIITDILST